MRSFCHSSPDSLVKDPKAPGTPLGELPQAAQDALERLAEACERMCELLALALALEFDAPLRAVVCAAAPSDTQALAFGDRGPYLRFANGSLEGNYSGEEPRPETRVFNIASALRVRRDLARTATTRIHDSGARKEAERLVRAFHGAAQLLSREDFAKLARWAPLLGVEAYRHASTMQMLLDETRSLFRGAAHDDSAVAWHWVQIHALSHSSLLGASAQPMSWLVGMARSFEWETWTPSFPLVRERLLRLAVRGAWVAARFGTGILDAYLRFVVEAPHPLRMFDAVLGSTAIVLASREHGAPLVREIERALARRGRKAADANERAVIDACTRSVRAVAVAVDGSGPAVSPLHLAVDGDADGAEIDEQGYFPAILALPAIVRADAVALFPEEALVVDLRRRWQVSVARAAFERTGAIVLCSCGSGRPVSGCCAN
jgi:hypothetical protein